MLNDDKDLLLDVIMAIMITIAIALVYGLVDK